MIKCAVFDADGTLLDSMPMWRDITYRYAASQGIDAPRDLHTTLNRLSIEQCAEYYRKLGAPGTREEVMEDLIQWALRGYRDQVTEKPGAARFLRLLHENGIHVAVATASHIEGVQAALNHLGMLAYVDFITSCTQVGKSKEHPDVFLRCAEEFQALPRECVVFEDSAYALRTARDAGFPTVAVADGISSSGDPERETPQAIRAIVCRYIADFNELAAELIPPEDDFGEALSRTVRG